MSCAPNFTPVTTIVLIKQKGTEKFNGKLSKTLSPCTSALHKTWTGLSQKNLKPYSDDPGIEYLWVKRANYTSPITISLPLEVVPTISS
jgi:hypothetical protein